MSESASPPSDDDKLLAEFIIELEKRGGHVVEEYGARYPHQAREFRDLAAAHQRMEKSRPEPAVEQPEQLGEFRIVRRIDRGGMGEIYEAVQDRLQRHVAVKTIRRGISSPEARARFLREQMVLARLHHTYIVPILTSGDEGTLQYFAMPYIDGAALNHVVQAAFQRGTAKPPSKTPSLPALAGMVVADSKDKPETAGPEAAPVKGTGAATANYGGQSNKDQPLSGRGAPQGAKLKLSTVYYRSVAEVMANVAEALDYAHGIGFIHRDMKPSNIMVDATGRCWVIDFGLAGKVGGGHGAPLPEEELDLRPEPATSGGVKGTPQYMAPEQYDAKADARSDVWGLGVTLYELLTLRRAFEGKTFVEIRQKVLAETPRPPQEFVRNMPPDLTAICRKAMKKEAGERYQTAGEFGEDLKRWLRMEPIIARPARTPRRVWLWARRNSGWAAMLGVLLLGITFLMAAVIYHEKTNAAYEKERAESAVEGKRKKEREILLQQMQYLRLTNRWNRWSRKAWEQAKEAARVRNDLALRNQAVASLAGMDAHPLRRFPHAASSVAFDRDGKRLLMGGMNASSMPDQKDRPARLWDGIHDVPLESQMKGAGPVAFDNDGRPLQLTVQSGTSLLLWDVAAQKEIQRFTVPGGATPQFLEIVLSSQGSVVGASVKLGKDKPIIFVWETRTGKLIQRLHQSATALALAADGSLCAAGDERGKVIIWSLPDGQQIAELQGDRAAALALAFGRDSRQTTSKGEPGRSWLIAVGDDGGMVTISNIHTRAVRSFCRGSSYHIYSMAFSPDGMTLASVGRSFKLWDVATGKSLLDIKEANWLTDVSFTPGGKSLAVSSRSAFGSPGQTSIWALENGRGIQTFRGLTGEVVRVTIAPNNRFLAAYAHDSRVGVWDLKTDRLLRIFEAPKIRWTDNGAIQFSPDSRRLAFSGSSINRGHAKLWDVATGEESGSWTFAPGVHNLLVFNPHQRLLQFQYERPPPTRQGVIRVRELRVGQPEKIRFTQAEFNRNLFFPQTPADGRFFLVVGSSARNRGETWCMKALDSRTGKEIWSSAPENGTFPEGKVYVNLDASGRRLAVLGLQDSPEATLIELPAGKQIGTGRMGSMTDKGWHGNFPYFTTSNHPDFEGRLALCRSDTGAIAMVLAIDVLPSGNQKQFDTTGTLYAWGNVDGTVNVCRIEEVRSRLKEIGLGW